jgi:2-C-methyl-D-erythritol 2,4-cyclodiphosphate synthase
MTEASFPDFRIGMGFDSHGLVEGRRLILGGVDVPHSQGPLGHSDGDVLVHAIMDALLGASNLGDKGVHFPSSDAQYKDISSLILLGKVTDLLRAGNWRISNVDATILAQNPRLGPYLPDMQRHIGGALSLEPGRVSIKVTTTDYLGFIGREEGIAACAIAAVLQTS